ncbi:MAG: M20/M25/M40 family metallo-hydrolase [bacterium]
MEITEADIEKYKARVENDRMTLLSDVVNISEVPAPTGEEDARAEILIQKFREIGVDNVYRDSEGNVVAHAKERDVPAVCVTAHLDTVFEKSVNHTVTIDDQFISGPGVGDDSLGLATLLSMRRLLPENEPGNLIFVATTGTEGRGNLKGSRYFVENCREDIGCVFCLEGHGLGRIDHWSLGTVRLQVTGRSEGGHVWRDETGQNPISVMSRLIDKIHLVEEEFEEDDNFSIINAGMIEGGTAFNTVPYSCELSLEIRSDDEDLLSEMSNRVLNVVHEVEEATSIDMEVQEVSRRPVTGLSEDNWFIDEVEAVHSQLGIDSILGPASSDSCIFLNAGLPTVTLGLARGENRHRTSERVYIDTLPAGQLQVLLAAVGAARRLNNSDT